MKDDSLPKPGQGNVGRTYGGNSSRKIDGKKLIKVPSYRIGVFIILYNIIVRRESPAGNDSVLIDIVKQR